MKKVVIIPARYSSSRLPGKPLRNIEGIPMIVRVCQAVNHQDFDQVVVATDDRRIADVVEKQGYQVVMTKSEHISGTDRLQEAATLLGLGVDDVVINLQGDEPLMPSENLTQVANLLVANQTASVATLYEEMTGLEHCNDANIVKLVSDKQDRVLYFSRAPIPFDRDKLQGNDVVFRRHVGIYAYRKEALDRFVEYPEAMLERFEKLEQLRFMENGESLVAQKAQFPIPVGVDTEDDLKAVCHIFKNKLTQAKD